MAEKIGIGRGLGRQGVGAHVIPPSRAGARRRQPAIAAATSSPRRRGIDHRKTLRLAGGKFQKAGAHGLVECPSPCARNDWRRPQHSRLPSPTSTGRSSSRVRSGLIRSKITSMQPIDQVEPQRAGEALIDAGGIDEAIAQHPAARGKRRLDQTLDMILPGGEKQQRLGERRPALGRSLGHEIADGLGARRCRRVHAW